MWSKNIIYTISELCNYIPTHKYYISNFLNLSVNTDKLKKKLYNDIYSHKIIRNLQSEIGTMA